MADFSKLCYFIHEYECPRLDILPVDQKLGILISLKIPKYLLGPIYNVIFMKNVKILRTTVEQRTHGSSVFFAKNYPAWTMHIVYEIIVFEKSQEVGRSELKTTVGKSAIKSGVIFKKQSI